MLRKIEMRVKIKDIVEYYKKFPDHKGKINVLTRHGYYPIIDAAKTATNETVYEVKTIDGKILRCSGNHQLLKNGEWCKVKNLNNGDIIHTIDGDQSLKYIRRTAKKQDLFDLQVQQVEEYYSNGITSHNSAILELFYYSIYGTTVRNLKKERIINNVTKKGGFTEITFRIETPSEITRYKIIRKLKPSSVELWKIGDVEENITRDSIANTNKYICDLIGSNPTIAKSCDIITSTDSVSFMSMKPEEKRKFHEDIFTLEVFGNMMKVLKEMVKDTKQEFSIISTKKDEIENSLKLLQEQLESQRKILREKDEIRETEKKALIVRKERLESEIYDMGKDMVDETKYQVESEKIKLGISQLDGKIGKLNTDIELVKRDIKDKKWKISERESVKDVVCSQCFQKIGEDHKDHLKKEVDDLFEGVYKFEKDLTDLEISKKELIDKKSKLQEKLQININTIESNRTYSNLVNKMKNEVIVLEEKIQNIDNDTTNPDILEIVEKNIKDTETRKTEIFQKWEELKVLLEDYETCRFVIGDDGVKSMIVKHLLDMLNSSIQSYIGRLGMNMRCKFDEYFEEKITNDKGEEMSYYNLSGAERRTVDIACAWAFKDIKRKVSNVSSNVEFLDEIIDNAFDEVGLDLLINVLKDRIDKQGLSCYVISHRKEPEKHIDGEIVYLVKENRITKRIDNQ